jgi:hypothetical protein
MSSNHGLELWTGELKLVKRRKKYLEDSERLADSRLELLDFFGVG